MPRFANTPFLQIVEQTCFGMVDFASALLSMKNSILEALNKETCAHNHAIEQSDGGNVFRKQLLADELEHNVFLEVLKKRRKFTVISA